MKNSLSPILKFNKSERIAIILLCALLLVLLAANQFWYLMIPTKQYNYTKYENLLNTKAEKEANYTTYTPTGKITDAPNDSGGERQRTEKTAYVPIVIDINTADSTQLLAIKGIGPVFAGRIVKYRKMLGGYAKKEQLLEVYGFDKERYDGILNQISLSTGIKKVNLNTEVFKELSSHPYIKYDLTKAIFKLRKKQGPFKTIEDIKQIDLVTDELYNKLAPYLSIK